MLRLAVNGVLNLDGAIIADGGNGIGANGGGGAGGSSGGSMWLEAGTFTGTRSILADGGAAGGPAGQAGSGAGGRIAVIFNTNTFTASLSAKGGTVGVGSPGGAYFLFCSNPSNPSGSWMRLSCFTPSMRGSTGSTVFMRHYCPVEFCSTAFST